MVNKVNQVANWERSEYEPSEAIKELDAKLALDPDNAELLMKKGLAFADMRLMREAVETFSKAIVCDPFCGILYRHRAHRHLSCWEFDEACADFELASRLIPDNWDVWYHLGLSHYLLGNYEKAAKAYKVCYEMSETEDKLIAVSDWYWMTSMRLGDQETADMILSNIHEGMDAKDNTSYYNRVLMYKGLRDADELLAANIEDNLQLITTCYGISNWFYLKGDMEKSNMIIDKILAAGNDEWWSAFGYLASMVDKKNRANNK